MVEHTYETDSKDIREKEDERKDRILQRRLSQVISSSPRSLQQRTSRHKDDTEEPHLIIRQEPLPWSSFLMASLAYAVSVPLYLSVLSVTKLLFVIGLAKDVVPVA